MMAVAGASGSSRRSCYGSRVLSVGNNSTVPCYGSNSSVLRCGSYCRVPCYGGSVGGEWGRCVRLCDGSRLPVCAAHKGLWSKPSHLLARSGAGGVALQDCV